MNGEELSEIRGSIYKKFKVNDKVAALVDGGGYAEYCITNERQTFLIPKNLSFEEASRFIVSAGTSNTS